MKDKKPTLKSMKPADVLVGCDWAEEEAQLVAGWHPAGYLRWCSDELVEALATRLPCVEVRWTTEAIIRGRSVPLEQKKKCFPLELLNKVLYGFLNVRGEKHVCDFERKLNFGHDKKVDLAGEISCSMQIILPNGEKSASVGVYFGKLSVYGKTVKQILDAKWSGDGCAEIEVSEVDCDATNHHLAGPGRILSSDHIVTDPKSLRFVIKLRDMVLPTFIG